MSYNVSAAYGWPTSERTDMSTWLVEGRTVMKTFEWFSCCWADEQAKGFFLCEKKPKQVIAENNLKFTTKWRTIPESEISCSDLDDFPSDVDFSSQLPIGVYFCSNLKYDFVRLQISKSYFPSLYNRYLCYCICPCGNNFNTHKCEASVCFG